jgi:salicylate hydroxylase
LPANTCRILQDLGVLNEVRAHGVEPADLFIRSYRGEQLYRQTLNPVVVENYGFPHVLIHRADIRRVLYDEAIRSGVLVRLGALVARVDFDRGGVELESGEQLVADLTVGADGEHSTCREALLGRKDPPRSSGDMVFRIAVPSQLMLQDADLAVLLQNPSVHAWYGPDSHAVCYQLQKDDVFNIVLTFPDNNAATIGPQPADLDWLRKNCEEWDTKFQKLLQISTKALKWTLVQMDELVDWHHQSGRFVLLGDSAHAMLPYLSVHIRSENSQREGN